MSQSSQQTIQLSSILSAAVNRGASDIHFVVGYPPHFRIQGELAPISSTFPVLKHEEVEQITRGVLRDENAPA